jgi:hypothetical protein
MKRRAFSNITVNPRLPSLKSLFSTQLSAWCLAAVCRSTATAFPSSAGRFWDEGGHQFRDEGEQFQADPRKVFGFAGMISTGSGASLDNTMAGCLRIGRRWVANSEL